MSPSEMQLEAHFSNFCSGWGRKKFPLLSEGVLVLSNFFEFLRRAIVIIASGLWRASKYVPPKELRTSVLARDSWGRVYQSRGWCVWVETEEGGGMIGEVKRYPWRHLYVTIRFSAHVTTQQTRERDMVDTLAGAWSGETEFRVNFVLLNKIVCFVFMCHIVPICHFSIDLEFSHT